MEAIVQAVNAYDTATTDERLAELKAKQEQACKLLKVARQEIKDMRQNAN
jgi:hypothetical protein